MVVGLEATPQRHLGFFKFKYRGSFNSVFYSASQGTREDTRGKQAGTAVYKPLPDGAPHLRAHVIIHSLSTLVSMPAVRALAGVRCDVVAHGVEREPLKVVELQFIF